MNDEIEEATPRCLICGQSLSSLENSLIKSSLDDRSLVYAHKRCATGLSRILEQVDYQKPQTTQFHELVRNVDGKMIVTRRDFPNQYVPILLFYSLHLDTPTTLVKLKEWLTLNDLDLSNPNVPVKRLLKKGALSIIVGEDKESRFFITKTGLEELEEYVRKMKEG